MQDKFLTVFAVFDNKTQKILKEYQDKVLALGHRGSQLMDIPFHISLGTYCVDDELKIAEKIHDACSKNSQFEIKLDKVNHFGHKVLFIEPEINKELLQIHDLFDNAVINKDFPWHPHATILMGDENQVQKAEELLQKIFKPLKSTIVGIQMGEFFPARMITKDELCK